jgi:hypothetical protein
MQGVASVLAFVREGEHGTGMMKGEFNDRQVNESQYSPYSVFIPIEGESYMNDEVMNTFVYLSHLRDTAKRIEAEKLYGEIQEYFSDGKVHGREYVFGQWMKVKVKYICQMDTLSATALLI